jgi:hypothetical protein
VLSNNYYRAFKIANLMWVRFTITIIRNCNTLRENLGSPFFYLSIT